VPSISTATILTVVIMTPYMPGFCEWTVRIAADAAKRKV